MSSSVLLLGATDTIGQKIAKQLSLQRVLFRRIAFLTPLADGGPAKEARYSAIELDRVVGSPADPESYRDFDIVVSAVADDICFEQIEYIDAAFAGGVKHFYPAEYGPDLTHPLVRNEPYFTDKIAVRKHLESRAQADVDLGYTYVMTGIFSELLLSFNILGLIKDNTSASYLGSPDAKVSTTYSDDVAKLIVTSLLPEHLTSLNARRHIRFAGSTLRTSSLFDAVAYVLRQPISITYETGSETSASPRRDDEVRRQHHVQQQQRRDADPPKDEQSKDADFSEKFTSLRRSIGFGGFEVRLEKESRQDVGAEDVEADVAVTSSSGEYHLLIKPKGWAEVVKEFFDSKGR